MSLLARMAPNDSIHQMEAARADRFWDALACSCDDRAFGACYLLGYAVEMLLKTAYFRFLGVPPGVDLKVYLAGAAGSPAFSGAGKNLHNLLAWARLLIDTRDKRGRPLRAGLASTLVIRVGEFAWNWSEVMRYRKAVEAADEAARLFRSFDWIHARYDDLWS